MYTNNINGLQKAMNQIGEIGVLKYLPKGMKVYDCPVHGKFLSHYKTKDPICPLCMPNIGSNEGNGTNATDVSLMLDAKDAAKAAMKEVLAGIRGV